LICRDLCTLWENPFWANAVWVVAILVVRVVASHVIQVALMAERLRTNQGKGIKHPFAERKRIVFLLS